MTHDREPCQFVPNMANDSSIHCHTGSVFMVAKLKKKAKPNPNDSGLGTLSIGPKYG